MKEILYFLREQAGKMRVEDSEVSRENLKKICRCMLILTDGMEEHPEGWDWDCMCNLCKSYA